MSLEKQASEVTVTYMKLYCGMLLLEVGSRDGGYPVCKLFGRVINYSLGQRLSFQQKKNEAEEQSCEKWTVISPLVDYG